MAYKEGTSGSLLRLDDQGNSQSVATLNTGSVRAVSTVLRLASQTGVTVGGFEPAAVAIQATDKDTDVTINSISGEITMQSIPGTQSAAFNVFNNRATNFSRIYANVRDLDCTCTVATRGAGIFGVQVVNNGVGATSPLVYFDILGPHVTP